METITLKKMGRTVKLGRRAVSPAGKAPKLAAYLNRAYLKRLLPESVDYTGKAKHSLSQMYANDQYGDCVPAGEAHLVGVRSANDTDGKEVVFPDSEIVAKYHRWCGAGDNGCMITEVLDALISEGFAGGHKIAGYVAIDPSDQPTLKWATKYLGGVTFGMSLPGNWADNTDQDFIWDTPATRSVGGHEVISTGYNAKGVGLCTWGMTGLTTWRALAAQGIYDECYASIGTDWSGPDGITLDGLDIVTLRRDLEQLGQGQVPPEPGPTPPPPPPPPVPTTGNILHLVSALSAGDYPLVGGMPVLTVASVRAALHPNVVSALDARDFDWQQFVALLLLILQALMGR